MKNEKNASLGVCGVLGIVFIVLKLVGVIPWSWLWVLAPFWIPASLAIVMIAIGIILTLITGGE